MISRRTAGWLSVAAVITAVALGFILREAANWKQIRLPDGSSLQFAKVSHGGWHYFTETDYLGESLNRILPDGILAKLGIKKPTRSISIDADRNALSFFFKLHSNPSPPGTEDPFWSSKYRLQVSEDGNTWTTASARGSLCNWVWVWEAAPGFKGPILHLQLQTYAGTVLTNVAELKKQTGQPWNYKT